MKPRRSLLTAVAATTTLALGAGLGATTSTATAEPRSSTVTSAATRTLTTYARDTWRSMDAMTDKATGLPADNIDGSLRTGTRSAFTSPTNIGAYLWSTVVARDLGFVSRGEAHQ